NGKQLFPCCQQFRIGFLDRGGDYDYLGLANVVGLVAHETRDAFLAQPLHICALRLVGALDAIAEVMQHLGNAAHAYSADPYEMHEAYALRHLHARVSFLNVSTDLRAAIASVRSASNCVAE